MADRFWVGGTGNWSDNTNHWSATSGGAPGASLPTSADNAIFDANSNTTAYTVTIDTGPIRNCLDLNFAAAPSVSGTITWAGPQSMDIRGSMTLLSGMTRTYTGSLTFSSTSTGRTITMNGVNLNGTGQTHTFSGSGGGWTLQDAFSASDSPIVLSNGTLNTNGQAVTIRSFTSTSGTRTLTLGASTVTLNFASAPWDVVGSGTFTFNANTSTLDFTSSSPTSIDFGALTYNNITFSGGAGGGTITLAGGGR